MSECLRRPARRGRLPARNAQLGWDLDHARRPLSRTRRIVDDSNDLALAARRRDRGGQDTVVTIRFSEAKEGALLTLTHENFSQPDERDRHESGWTSSLDCLEEAIDEDA